MDIDSESSCTYKDYITAYSSTRDSELWTTNYAIGTELNMNVGVSKVPVILSDDALGSEVCDIPAIGPPQMEEMMMEPLFSVPDDYRSLVESVTQYKKGSIPVSLSNYGLKCLVFSVHGCIMCVKSPDDMSTIGLYIPYRFFKKVASDCEAQGVECESRESYRRQLYHTVDIRNSLEPLGSILRHKQVQILSNANLRPVTESLTPVYQDGFSFYYPVDATLLIMLDPSKRTKKHDESGNLIVYRSKRHIKMVPLCIGHSTSHGNDVASRTPI